MKAAARRFARERGSLAEAIYVGTRADHRELERYLDSLDNDRPPLPPEALAGAMRSYFAGLATVRRADFLKSRS